jgi:hypothetical protein
MKKPLKNLVVFAVTFGAALQIYSQGYIVPNGVVTNLFPGEIDVWNPGSQITGFMLNPTGVSQPPGYTNAFRFMEPVTIGVRVFFLSANDPFSLSQIQSQTYTELLEPSVYVFEDGVPFYVGLYTGANLAPPYPAYPPYYYLDPVFGWAQLVNNGGTIQLLDSALAHQAGGIYAGTLNLIPEPSVGSLFMFGLLGLGRHWRKRRRLD